ncbi:MAG TPA: von Willebrand factor type A domain-containing protein, partial [Planctomycetota bacterium]|nr:von Willebrand factor type A domain-containing protein [Planctomycetota bacterium]
EAERLLGTCLRRPGESLRDMFFRHWGTRPFTPTSEDALSTFAVDVDTASYALARAMLNAGHLPAREQVRVEEFVNYFDAELAPPTAGTFALTTELGPSLFRPQGSQHWLLRVGVKGREVAEHERRAVALTFVVDVSGSMNQGGRLQLVQNALRQLLAKLEPADSVAIVKFSNAAELVLPRTSAGQRGVLEAAVAGLASGGGTNVEGGLVLGFDEASRSFDPEAGNRVVLLSDGVGNIGATTQEQILARVAGERAKGIYLNTVGVGLGNHNDAFLEQLANRGDGLCNYVDGPLEAKRALVDNFLGAFETIARDVKLQVEFDPQQVGSWRLLGYENRALADREFRQDAVDAGEVGSGHAVVALYELADVRFGEGDLATVRVRFKAPFDGSTPEGATAETAAEVAAGASA